MMGRGDDLGEIREVRSARSAILRSRRRDERKRSQEAVDRTGRFQRPPLALALPPLVHDPTDRKKKSDVETLVGRVLHQM
jgi:hypothetical protein